MVQIKLTEQGRNKVVKLLEDTTPEKYIYWNTTSELVDDIEDTLTAEYSEHPERGIWTAILNKEDYTREVIL